MLAVMAKGLLDAVYVGLFFLVMSLVAYGAHRLVRMSEVETVDRLVVGVLHVVEVALVTIDGVGVVSASLILTFTFVVALIRANSDDGRP